MKIIRALAGPFRLKQSVVTLGTFDGMHRGHRQIVRSAVAWARKLKVPCAAVTFENHPRSVLPGRDAPDLITTVGERSRLLAEAGVDLLLLLKFDLKLAALTPGQFVERVLVRKLGARGVLLGFNSKFGRNGEGDLEFLHRVAPEYGFAVRSTPPVMLHGSAVSSTKIRALLGAGEIGRAKESLGRPYRLTGVVARGAGRGRTLGVPTANLARIGTIVPADGVYACLTRVGKKLFPAVVNVGTRPTFEKSATRHVEAHLLGFTGNLYGKTVSLDFHARLRDERKFPSKDALLAQIRRDVGKTKTFFTTEAQRTPRTANSKSKSKS